MQGHQEHGDFQFHLVVRSDGTVYCPRALADVPETVCQVCGYAGGVSGEGEQKVLDCALVRTSEDVCRALYPPVGAPPA